MWNFDTMEMGFTVGKKDVRLVRIGHSVVTPVGLRGFNKALEKKQREGNVITDSVDG